MWHILFQSLFERDLDKPARISVSISPTAVPHHAMYHNALIYKHGLNLCSAVKYPYSNTRLDHHFIMNVSPLPSLVGTQNDSCCGHVGWGCAGMRECVVRCNRSKGCELG